jgi:hypothetical protein
MVREIDLEIVTCLYVVSPPEYENVYVHVCMYDVGFIIMFGIQECGPVLGEDEHFSSKNRGTSSDPTQNGDFPENRFNNSD